MTRQDLEKLVGYKKPHKYLAKATYCKLGHRHPSKAEAMHCWALQCEIKGGIIKDLEWEKSYDLIVSGKLVGVHKPDFTYKRPILNRQQISQQSFVQTFSKTDFKICVDEVKGFATADWIFKRKIFQALYPEIEYRVIK